MNEQTPSDLKAEDFQNALKVLDAYVDVTPEDLIQLDRIARKQARLRQAEQSLVRDVMTSEVVTVKPDMSLSDAARILLELRISGLPVVDENKKLVGIVTEADFLCAMGIPCHHPAHSLWQMLDVMFRHHPDPGNTPTSVADIMTSRVITISENKSLHDAIDTMKKNHIKRIVITNEAQEVHGIITRSNLIQVLLQKILE